MSLLPLDGVSIVFHELFMIQVDLSSDVIYFIMPFGASSGQQAMPGGCLTLTIVVNVRTRADFHMSAQKCIDSCFSSFPLQACNVFRLYNGKAAEAELKALADRGRNLQVWFLTPPYHRKAYQVASILAST